MGGLVMELRELLGRDVDVTSVRSLKPRIRERVLVEAVPLCET
jgi:predicted nucleotidyltransferase